MWNRHNRIIRNERLNGLEEEDNSSSRAKEDTWLSDGIKVEMMTGREIGGDTIGRTDWTWLATGRADGVTLANGKIDSSKITCKL